MEKQSLLYREKERFLTQGETESFIQREREIPHKWRNRVFFIDRKRDSSQREKQSFL